MQFEFQDKSLQDSFMNILNTFSAADGGIAFIKFRCMLENLENEDSNEAYQLLQIIKQFSKLIDVSQKRT